MEKFKQEAYIDAYNEAMKFEKPTISEMSRLATHLADLQITNDNLFLKLRDHFNHRKSISQLDKQTGLQDVLNQLKLNEQTEVIVIWQYPNDVDKFELFYLLNHWEDVWYPPSDEVVCLFFPLTDQLVLLTDYGVIYY